MTSKRYTEEFKIEAVKQVTDRVAHLMMQANIKAQIGYRRPCYKNGRS